jgi:hypothetical protein
MIPPIKVGRSLINVHLSMYPQCRAARRADQPPIRVPADAILLQEVTVVTAPVFISALAGAGACLIICVYVHVEHYSAYAHAHPHTCISSIHTNITINQTKPNPNQNRLLVPPHRAAAPQRGRVLHPRLSPVRELNMYVCVYMCVQVCESLIGRSPPLDLSHRMHPTYIHTYTYDLSTHTSPTHTYINTGTSASR